MSKFSEALGLQRMHGPRTAKREERNDQLRKLIEKGYQPVDQRRGQSGGTEKPRSRRSSDG